MADQARPAVVADLAGLETGLPTAETKTDPPAPATTAPAAPPAPPPRRRVPWQPAAGALVVVATAVGVWHVWSQGHVRTYGPYSFATPTPGPGRGMAPPPFADRLRVKSLEVRHFAAQGDGSLDRGLLGYQSFAARLGDQVTVRAHLSRPGHAFILALRADGTTELCYPEDQDLPPPATERPEYPSAARDERYGLREGAGLCAFAVVASDRPLPPYRRWSHERIIPWVPEPVPAGAVWYDDGRWVEVLGPGGSTRGARGNGEKVPGPSALVRVTNALAADGSAAVALGFVVTP